MRRISKRDEISYCRMAYGYTFGLSVMSEFVLAQNEKKRWNQLLRVGLDMHVGLGDGARFIRSM